MGIMYDEKQKMFNLQTKNTSYVMALVRDKYLAHVYWGKKLTNINISNALQLRWAGFSALEDNKEPGFSLDCLAQEYPTGCGTDYRIPAIELTFADGSRVLDLQYADYKIIKGKPPIKGLPATYAESDSEASTLQIKLTDNLKAFDIILSYTVFEEMDAITRHVEIINNSNDNIVIDKIMSASVDMDNKEYDFLHLFGGWGKERHIDRTPLRTGNQSIESRRGASSHQQNPFFALVQTGANEEYGNVYGINFVYSGNFVGGAEVDQLLTSRVYMGINDYDFSWKLEPHEEFTTPEVVMVYSDKGIGGMSRIYHRLYRKRLVRGRFRDEVRPILANNWEATYFDFSEEKILGLAKEAKSLGIELLVLDDGWFGKRNDDRSSLGDWFVNKDKLPDGIESLSKKVNDIGLKFGLWFEPEMISPDSELYRAHPDWCIHTQGRVRTECRNQLTLDLSRKDVCDYIIETISCVLDSASIGYVKWDMNRHMTNLGSAGLPSDRQKEMPHRYMLGLYRVLEEIVSTHPDILFESCSGGGGRFDPGMLYYMPQTWTSDDTDAVERLYIQYGTSIVYPISSMGSHVSAVPCHQTNRITSLKMRGDVAMSGNFGYELDLMKFTDEEKEEVKKQIEQYKDLRTFIQSGEMYRLLSPFESNNTAWMFISEDGKDIFAAYFRIKGLINEPVSRMKFTALDSNATYQIMETGDKFSGDELMQIGLPVAFWGDYQSKTWRIRKI